MKKNKIIIASYPRSGNTFLRNILYYVYGLDSIGDVDIRDIDEWKTSDIIFIKTHELPGKFFELYGKYPVIYLVRDGRDALVSQAFHRINIINPQDDFLQILGESIEAHGGSYFGGWEKNVFQWSQYAASIIRFEDLIRNPKQQLQKLKKLLNLPDPDWDKLPTFEQLKQGKEHFVDRDTVITKDQKKRRRHELFFRKGQIGEWKQEMPKELQKRFWRKSAYAMTALGYEKNGSLSNFEHLEPKIIGKGIKRPLLYKLNLFRR